MKTRATVTALNTTKCLEISPRSKINKIPAKVPSNKMALKSIQK